MRCSGCTPKDAGHKVRIVSCQFFHAPRSVIRDLQKQRASGPWNRCEQADDLVVDEIPDAVPARWRPGTFGSKTSRK